MRSPNRWPWLRSAISSGWKPRRPIWPTPSASPRRFTPGIRDKMLAYNLSPSFNWDTTGMSDERDAGISRRVGQVGLRLQLHHLRWTSGRRHGGGGIRHRLEARWHALAGAFAAKAAAGGVSLQDAANAGRWSSPGRRADGVAPAVRRPPRPWAKARLKCSTWFRPKFRCDCWTSGWSCGPRTMASPVRCMRNCVPTPRARSCWR